MNRLEEILRRRRTLLTAFAVVTLLCSYGANALAQDEEPDRDYWVKRYETLVADVENARARAALLETNYTKARQRNYPRGEPFEKLTADRDEAVRELAKLEEELEAFPDEARRAGALPGWFRDLDDY